MDSGTPIEFWLSNPDVSIQYIRSVIEAFPGVFDSQYDHLTPFLIEWASNPLLSLIVVNYPIQEEMPLKALCVDLVELFEGNNIPVIWLVCRPRTPPKEPITTHILRSLIEQVMKLPHFPQQARLFTPPIENENEWFVFLGTVLAELENVFIVIDSTVLRYGQLRDSDVCQPWIINLLRICDIHRRVFNKGRYLPKVGIKVVLAAHDCGSRQLEPTGPQWDGHLLYVDITQFPERPQPISWQENIALRQTARMVIRAPLNGIVRAYNDRIMGRSIRRNREQPPVSPPQDGADGSSAEFMKISAQKAVQTSLNWKQPSVPTSRDKVEFVETSIRTAFPGAPFAPTARTGASGTQYRVIQSPFPRTLPGIAATVEEEVQSARSLERKLLARRDAVQEVEMGHMQMPGGHPSALQSRPSLRTRRRLGGRAAFYIAGSQVETPRFPLHATDSQQAQTQLSGSQPISSKTEDVSRKAAVSVSNFQLFDNQNLSGDAADRADKADMWFKYLRVELHPALPRIPDKKDMIRIAVLDTGVCMGDNFIHLKENRTRITYQSFVTGDPNPTEPSDLVGHGTHVAGLLLQVAPNADIYVAKISDKDGLYDPHDIARAIRHSVDNWHAHIISMSFGFDNLTQQLDCIKREILYAHSKETVLFAAARNNGGVKGIAYPASQTEVICINSTDGEGNPSPFNPSPRDDKNFSTLGEAVLSSWPRSVQKRMTGTSFATPIAAGIAAVTMDYMEQRRRVWSGEDDRYVAKRIKTRGGIIAVFDKHLSDPRSGFRFLCPWLFFNKDETGLDRAILKTLRRYA